MLGYAFRQGVGFTLRAVDCHKGVFLWGITILRSFGWCSPSPGGRPPVCSACNSESLRAGQALGCDYYIQSSHFHC